MSDTMPAPKDADDIHTHEDLPQGTAISRVFNAMHNKLMGEIASLRQEVADLRAEVAPKQADEGADKPEPWVAHIQRLEQKFDDAVKRIHKMYG